MDEKNTPKDNLETEPEVTTDQIQPGSGVTPEQADQKDASEALSTDTNTDEVPVSGEVVVGHMHSNRRTVITLISLAILVLVAAVVLVVVDNTKQPAKTAQPVSITQNIPTTANVSITAAGFSPATVEIKKGQSVTWKNTDSADHQPAADPYPTNTSLPDWGKGEVLKTNDTFTYQFEKAGTYTYQDNLNPYKIKGTVIVKE